MTVARYVGTVTDTLGHPDPLVSFTVSTDSAGTVLAAIFTDDTGSTPIAGSVAQADAYGNYSVFAASGEYWGKVTGQGFTFPLNSHEPGSGGGGTGTVTSVTAADSTLTVTSPTTTPAVKANVGTTAGTVAAGDDSRIVGAAQKASNLSDLANAATARTNLGLGTAATQASSAFDTSGAASAAQAAAIAASLQRASNLSDLASASSARTNLGLGTAATQPSTAFDAAGLASAEAATARAAEALRILPRGAWAPSTVYAVNDMVTTTGVYGGTWLCLVAHTSVSSFTGWSVGNWRWVGGSGFGTAASKPSPTGAPDGYIYFETDSGIPWQIETAAWVQIAAGVNAVSGGIVAGPVLVTAAFDIMAVGTTPTDVPSCAITVPASASKGITVECTIPLVNAGTGTAAVASKVSAQFTLCDASNNPLAYGVCTFQQVTAANVALQQGVPVMRLELPAPVTSATYHLRANTVLAVPANWSSCKINTSGVAYAPVELVARAA